MPVRTPASPQSTQTPVEAWSGVEPSSDEEDCSTRPFEAGDDPADDDAVLRNYLPQQGKVRNWYKSDKVQIFVAILILLNFLFSIANVELIDDASVDVMDFFKVVEYIFNTVFTLELVVNMYGGFFLHFWQSAWNVFDFVVVFVSLMSMGVDGLPGFTVLRLFRAFRVFRLFRRVPSLHNIVGGIAISLRSVSSALFLLSLIMGIWSIMGVTFFREDFPDEFGSFFHAMLTCFQIMTYDNWASGIARPVLVTLGGGYALYFISFLFVAGIIMLNVILAILVESYLLNQMAKEETRLQSVLEEIKEHRRTEAAEHLCPSCGAPAGGMLDDDEFLKSFESNLDTSSQDTKQSIDDAFMKITDVFDRVEALVNPHAAKSKKLLRVMRDEAEHEARLAALLQQQRENNRLWSFCVGFNAAVETQIGVAVLILMNFFVAVVEAQTLPHSAREESIFYVFEILFTVIFLVELLINMYANYFLPFWKSAWNWFDFVVVFTSVLSLLVPNMPGFTILRLLRAFRVLRLFKRIGSLRNIILGVMNAAPGVANAFVVLGLIVGIWSILGVGFFADDYPELYGSFFQAMLTCFQIATFDGWSSEVTRPILNQHGGGYAIYFLSFVFAAGIMMMNVVVAILLDKYLSATSEGTIKHDDNLEALQRLEKTLVTRLQEMEHFLKANNLRYALVGMQPGDKKLALKCAFESGDTSPRADKISSSWPSQNSQH